jgi:pSer/pThr/pTyr-binding forkhead associated (FHA) protein/tetratricopeptide (TPR) repeat protein
MKLIIYAKGRAEEIPLEGTIVVGRGPACELRLHDPSVSTRHAQFTVDGDKVTLTDLNSTNGTFVNEDKIGERELQDGDRIRLGGITVIFSCGETTDRGEVSEESQIMAPVGEDSDDEPTPVDESFAPQDVPSESPRPELHSRDGKWYLREKVSGKEVEIVPVRKGGPAPSAAEVTGQVKDFMYANTLAAAIAILIVGAVFIFVLRGILVVPPPPPGSWNFGKYASAVRRSTVEIDADTLSRAEYFLARAISKYDKNDLAKMLMEYVKVLKNERTRNSMRERSRALMAVGKYAGKEFPDIADWAKKRLRAIKRENKYEEMFSEAQGLINGGQFKQAADILTKIPGESRWYRKAQEQVADIAGTLVRAKLDMARAAIAKENWREAIDHLMEAEKNGAPQALVKSNLTMCRQNQRDKERLAKGRESYEKGQPGAAMGFLTLIPNESRYREDRDALITKIKLDRVLKEAKVFYARGEWGKALKLLASVDDPSCKELAQHIDAVRKVYDDAEKAYAEERHEEAITLWEQVTTLEKDARNFFHIQSQKRLSEWKGHPEKIAAIRWRHVEAAEAKGNYVEARKWINECLRLVPKYKPAMDKLKDYRDQAEKLFLKAMNLQHSKPTEAVRLYQQIKDMLPPEDAYHKRATEEIKLLTKPPTP